VLSAAVVSRPFAAPRHPGPAFGPRGAAVLLHLAGVAALTLVLASSGAFDSDRLPVAQRTLMFAVVSILLIGQASLLAGPARRLAGAKASRKVVSFVAALAATLLLMTVEIDLLKATPLIPYARDPLPAFALFLAPFVGPVAAVVLGLRWRDSGRGRRAAPPPLSGGAPPAPEPAAAKDSAVNPVLRIQAVDHYLEVWTPGRRRLLRGPMSEAVRRLPPGSGVQPHRSWWIARSEILRLERRGRDHRLVLRDGLRVPVARARVAEVRRVLGL